MALNGPLTAYLWNIYRWRQLCRAASFAQLHEYALIRDLPERHAAILQEEIQWKKDRPWSRDGGIEA